MKTVEQVPNPAVSDWYTEESLRQKDAHRSGVVLKRHIDDAHGGKIDPKCRGCAELQKKMSESVK